MVLRDSLDADGSRQLSASLNQAGDLVIEGLDRGDGVERIFGEREYEWIWTVRTKDVPGLWEALGGGSSVLDALQLRFSGEAAADLGSFLDTHGIPYEAWSRLGD